VQPDHLDFYGSFAAVQEAYAQFAATVQPGGLLVTCADDQGSRDLCDRARAAGTRVATYGVAADADVRVTEIGGAGMKAHAVLLGAGGVTLGRLDIGIPGRHNLLNATAAFVAATQGLGQPAARVLQGLAGFTGTRRRFEPKGEVAGVRVVDDYAHNPGKVAAVVETALSLAAPGRLIVVFQPHLYSRTRDFAAELATALLPADLVIVMDVYAAREDPMPGVTGALITDQLLQGYAGSGGDSGSGGSGDSGGSGGRAGDSLGGSGTGAGESLRDREAAGKVSQDPVQRVRFVPSWSDVAPLVVQIAKAGDLVLTTGAGDVTMIGPEVLRLLRNQPEAGTVASGGATA
jgi:UDP-N-acetylmuramate--alanine ligase